eukprot:4496-Heterococcus_DN1.PRE.2
MQLTLGLVRLARASAYCCAQQFHSTFQLTQKCGVADRSLKSNLSQANGVQLQWCVQLFVTPGAGACSSRP